MQYLLDHSLEIILATVALHVIVLSFLLATNRATARCGLIYNRNTHVEPYETKSRIGFVYVVGWAFIYFHSKRRPYVHS